MSKELIEAGRQVRDSFKQLMNLITLSSASFAITDLMLRDRPAERIMPQLEGTVLSWVPPPPSESYIEEGWLTLAEYAKHIGVVEEDIAAQFEKGACGQVCSEDGKTCVYFPQKEPDPALPFGKKYRRMKKSRQMILHDVIDSEDPNAQRKLLGIVESLGETSQTLTDASYLVFLSVFVSRWIFFESYLRTMVRCMYKLFPENLLGGKRGQTSLTFSDLFLHSDRLSSIESLREYIVQNEINKAEGESSVHGLINYPKFVLQIPLL